MQQIDYRQASNLLSSPIGEAAPSYVVHVEAYLVHYREYLNGPITYQFIRADSEKKALALAKEYIPRTATIVGISHCTHERSVVYDGALKDLTKYRESVATNNVKKAIMPPSAIPAPKPKPRRSKDSERPESAPIIFSPSATRASTMRRRYADMLSTPVTIESVTLTALEWMERRCISLTALLYRMRCGSSLEDAATTPLVINGNIAKIKERIAALRERGFNYQRISHRLRLSYYVIIQLVTFPHHYE